jgi:putative PIN family toxin of toxin-antitoxin system
MSRTPDVVVDAGVWVSGVFFRRGIPAAILRAWRDGRFGIVLTSATLSELESKLREKVVQFRASPTLAEEWIAYIRAFARVAPFTEEARGVCRDADDDKFLDAAVSGGAQYIVSADHDLQALGEYQGAQIVSPRDFAERLGIVPLGTRSGSS